MYHCLGSFHKYQCQLDLYGLRLKDTKDGCTIFNSLAIIAGKPASFWLENQTKFLVPNAASDWPTPNNTDLEKLTNLFNMITNEEDVSRESQVRHIIVSVLILRAFRKTSFYEDSSIKVEQTGSLSKEELVIGKLLYRIRLIKDMNAHPIWGVENNIKDKSQVGTEQIGKSLLEKQRINKQYLLSKEVDYTLQSPATSTVTATPTLSGSILARRCFW